MCKEHGRVLTSIELTAIHGSIVFDKCIIADEHS